VVDFFTLFVLMDHDVEYRGHASCTQRRTLVNFLQPTTNPTYQMLNPT